MNDSKVIIDSLIIFSGRAIRIEKLINISRRTLSFIATSVEKMLEASNDIKY